MADKQKDKIIEQANRLNQLRKKINLSQRSMAQLVGANQGNTSTVLSGKRKIPDLWIYKLKEKYVQINTDWIWTGEGEMLMTAQRGDMNSPPIVSMGDYVPGRSLKKEQLERLVLQLLYRVEELEAWKRDVEERLKGE